MIYFLNNVHNYDNYYSKDLADLLSHNFKKIRDSSILRCLLKYSECFGDTPRAELNYLRKQYGVHPMLTRSFSKKVQEKKENLTGHEA
jgi:hypothetical protein